MTLRVAWIALAVIVVGLVVWTALLPSERPYYDKVAELRAAGQPVDFDGLAPPVGPADENGAEALLDADAWFQEHAPLERLNAAVGPWNPPAEGRWTDAATPVDVEALAILLDEMKPCLDEIRAAAGKPRVQFRSAKRDEFGWPDVHRIRAVQRATHILEAAAVAARTPAERLDAIATELALSERIECFTTIDFAVDAVLTSIATRELRDGVAQGTLDASTARARLDGALRGAWLARVPELVRGERAFVVQYYKTVLDGTGSWEDKRSWRERLFGRKPRESSFVFTPATNGIAPQVVAELDGLTRALAVPVSSCATYRPAVAAAVARTPLGVGAFVEKMVGRLACVDAQLRLARVALAVAERKAKTGALPASLDEVKPAFPDGMPLDPFTDAPFVYETTPTGVRIASVGRVSDETPLGDSLRQFTLEWTLK